MIARGFKPVGWVCAIAGAALGCYMLSLNVAAERAELAQVEWQIIAAKQDIRTLQTELGTRGRMSQLEHWNAEVLALSAPTSAQYLDSAVTLARFDQKVKTIEERAAKVQLASADAAATLRKPEPSLKTAAKKLAPADYAAAGALAEKEPAPLVRAASYTIVEGKPVTLKKAAFIQTKAEGTVGGQ
jgi:hypothetical protein